MHPRDQRHGDCVDGDCAGTDGDTKMTDAILQAALEAHKPALVARYTAMTQSTFSNMVAMHGPALRGISNCWTYARMWSGWISGMTRHEGDARILDEARVAKSAAAYADATIEAWAGKIATKMGEVEGATIHHLDGAAFRITGTLAGKRVGIDQNMILNVSSKGLPFNQFPARIYVDGKFTSEAAWKRMRGA